MKQLSVCLVAIIAAASLAIAGCSQAAPAPAPTAAPAKPAAAPTSAPAAAPAPTTAPAAAAAPTAVPAKKVDYPQKGKAINFNVPFGAGSATDIGARMAAQYAEKELGTTFQIVNKPGAGSQTGIQEFVDTAKPDGYGLVAMNIPGPILFIANPERNANFKRTDFQPIAVNVTEVAALGVAANGPYKSFQDVINAAKANPGKIRGGTTGLLTDDHLRMLDIEKQTGVKFAAVHFDTNTEREPALLGGKIDVSFGSAGTFFNLAKQGELKVVGVLSSKRYPAYPDVPTLEEMGVKAYGGSFRGFYAKAGTPKEIVDIMAAAFKKSIENPEATKKLQDQGFNVEYMGPADVEKLWIDTENTMVPLFKAAYADVQATKK